MLANLLVHLFLVLFTRTLDKEVSRINLEQAGQKLVVRDLGAVDAVAVASRAGVDANVLALFGAEAGKNSVVEVDEGLKQIRVCPWIAWVLFGCQTSLGEVDAHALCAGREAAPDVLLAFVDEVFYESVFGVALDFACVS